MLGNGEDALGARCCAFPDGSCINDSRKNWIASADSGPPVRKRRGARYDETNGSNKSYKVGIRGARTE